MSDDDKSQDRDGLNDGSLREEVDPSQKTLIYSSPPGRMMGPSPEYIRASDQPGSPPDEDVSAAVPRTPSRTEKEARLTIDAEEMPTQAPEQDRGAPGKDGVAPDGIPVMLVPIGNNRSAPFQAGSQMAMLISASGYSPLQSTTDNRDGAPPSLENAVRSALRLAAFLRQHRVFLIVMAALGLIGGAVSQYLLPPARKAEAEVTLHPEPKVNPVDPNSRPGQSDSPELFANAEKAFTSLDAVRSTLKAMGRNHLDDALVKRLARGLKFESVGLRDFVATAKIGTGVPGEWDPAQFLQVHLRVYAEAESNKLLKVLSAQVDFLRTQAAASEAQLKKIEAEMLAYRQAHAAQLADQSTVSPQTRSTLEQRRLELTGEIRRREGELAGVHRQIKRGSHLERTKVQYAQSYREALAVVNRQLGEARSKGYADGHPEVSHLLAEKANLEGLMDAELHSDLSGIDKRSNAADEALLGRADQAESQLGAARAERDFILSSLQKLNKVSSNQPEVDAGLDELTRKQAEAKRIHDQLFDRMRQSEVQLELERVSAASRFELTLPPKEEPVKIGRALAQRMALGELLGLALAFAILFVGVARRYVAKVSAATGLVLLATLASSCAHDPAFVWVQEVPSGNQAAVLPIAPRDTISVEIVGQPSLSGEMVVREDGNYFNPLIGGVAVAGLSPTQAAGALREKLKTVVVDPVVSVSMVRPAPIRVGVMGEVKNPGSYELNRDRRLYAALLAAGWTTEFAHDDRLFVLRPAGPHPRIRFRLRDLTASELRAAQFQLLDGDIVYVE